MKWWVIVIIPFFLYPLRTYASVVINEFSSNSDPEWVELYNPSGEIVNLSDWKITDGNASTSDDLTLNGCIADQGFRSFSRSAGWLNDTGGDTINLKDSGGNQINQIIYGSGGVVGIPSLVKSASRVLDGSQNWQILDLPTQRNDVCQVSPSPSPSSTPIPTPVPTSTPNDYSNLFISEYFPYPDSGNEWVEIYNPNDFDVNLDGWFIDDIADDGSAPTVISGVINTKSYKVFYLSIAFLNNGGDDVRLLNGNKTEKNKTSFESSTKGKSWSKDTNSNWCQVDPTPNSSNSSCPDPTPQPSPTATVGTATPTPTPRPTPTPTPKPTPTPTPSQIPATPSPTPLGTSTPIPTPKVLAKSTENKNIYYQVGFIVVGLLVLGVSGVMFLLTKSNNLL